MRGSKLAMTFCSLLMLVMLCPAVAAAAPWTVGSPAALSFSNPQLIRPSLAVAQSCTDSWLGGTGTWDTASDWSKGKVPASNDDVCITAAGTYTVTLGNEMIDVAGLTVGGPGSSPTLLMGNNGFGVLDFAVAGTVDVAATGTINFGYEATFTAGSLINAGTFETLNSGNSAIALGYATNTGTFSVDGGATLSLTAGTTFDNAGGTISNADGQLEISTPSSGTATLELDSGGLVENTGTLDVADAVQLDGGSLCGSPLRIGIYDNGQPQGALSFAASPSGTGPACAGGLASDTVQVLNVAATLSGTIPASYTVEAGDLGGSLFDLALSGDVINDGTLVAGFDGDVGNVTAANASDYLTNNATVEVPNGGEFNAPLINNGTFDLRNNDETATLQNGWTWENTNAGTIKIESGGWLQIFSPSGQTATLKLQSGGVIDNSGKLEAAENLQVNGGSICGNPLELGVQDGGTGGALDFPATPSGTGPACAGGLASDTVQVLNVAATLSGTIPASYTVEAGDLGGSLFDLALSGDVINDGTLVAGFDGDVGNVTAANASDYLTNNATVEVPNGGEFNAPLINNGTFDLRNNDETATLQNGWTWENTNAGTIKIESGGVLTISSPSGQSADFNQDGVIDNAQLFYVADPIVINGGTICGNSVDLGYGDGNTGLNANPLTLTFATSPAAGPPCPSGQATDGLFINNVDATLESNIPAGYTIAIGNDGPGLADVSTPGNLTNAGSLEPDWGATLAVGGGAGTLNNTGTIEVPDIGGNDGPILDAAVNNLSGVVDVPYTGSLNVTGSYTQGAGGTLVSEIDGTTPQYTYGQLVVDGGSSLAGTLDIDTIAGFSPTAGNSFKILDGSAVSGAFGTVRGLYPPGANSAYGVTYDPDDVTLGVTGVSTTTLTVADGGPGSGTVTSEPAGIDCGSISGSTCVTGFTQNTPVTLTATPAAGSVFTGWSGACSNSSGSCQVTLGTAQAVTANFVSPGATVTALSSNTEPSVTGQRVTYTATISPKPDGGTVSFSDGGTTIAGCGSVNVNTTNGTAACAPTYASVGSHTIQAGYSGDTSFAASQSAYQLQLVDPASTTTSVQSLANPSVVAQNVTYIATVSPAPDGGTIAFTDGGTTITGCGAVSINQGNGTADCQTSYPATGAHTIEASYTGDSDYGASQTGVLDQIVNAQDTSTSLGSSANPSTPGAQVTYTATVSPVPDAGTVTFTDAGTPINGCIALAVDTGTGEAQCQVTYTFSGSHPIVASYSGDALFGASDGDLSQAVQTDGTTTSLASSANPSLPAAQVTYTATVSPVPDGGTVTFTDNGTTISGCSAVAVNTTNGKATCTATYASSGSHSIAATYNGDVLYGTSYGDLAEVVSSSSTTLQSSANPSVPDEQVTYTATVSPVPDGGTVAFTDSGTTISGCGAVAVSTTTGQAECSATYGAVSSHSIEAAYSGDANYPPSDGTLTQTVSQISTSTSLGSSANPSLPSAQVTYTATVSPVPDGGTVTFTDNGATISGCSQVAVSTSTGQATCAQTYASSGSHPIVAAYSGDAVYVASSANLTQTVNGSSTSLSSSANPSAPGQQVTYTATVAPVPDGGTVTFTDNGATIDGCSAVAINTGTGQAQCSATYASVGSHPIEALYSGDSSYPPSNTTLTQKVSQTSTSTGLSSSANPSVVGQQVTYTATVSPVPDAGTITFTDNGTTITGCSQVPVNSTTGVATCSESYTSVLSYYQIVATYSGDTTYAGSQGSLTQSLDFISTSATISSSADPSTAGGQVTYTVTVSPAPNGGTVSFLDGTAAVSGCLSIAVNTSNGVASCTTTYSTAGSHSIAASYSGDQQYASAYASLTQTVNAPIVAATPTVTPTTITLTASLNPWYYNPSEFEILTATVSPSAAAAGGTVTISSATSPDGPFTPDLDCSDLTSGPRNEGTLNHTASDQFACLPDIYDFGLPGVYVLRATYSGDSTYGPSTTTILFAQGGGTYADGLFAVPSQVSVGEPTAILAYVEAPYGGGALTLTDNGQPVPTCPAGSSGSSTYLQYDRLISCSLTYKSPGTHVLRAAFNGSTVYPPWVESTTVTVTGASSAPTTTVEAGQTSLVAPASPCTSCTTTTTIVSSTPLVTTTPSTQQACTASAGHVARAASAASSGSTYNTKSVTKPITQTTAKTVAANLQATQTALAAVSGSKLATSVPAVTVPRGNGSVATIVIPSVPTGPTLYGCGGTGGSGGGSVGAIRTKRTRTTPIQANLLGPSVSLVLAGAYSAHPTAADIAALDIEIRIARSSRPSVLRNFARRTLIDAYELGRATLAHQLGDRALTQLLGNVLTLSRSTRRVPSGKGRTAVVQPSGLGARVLRLLEIYGLSRRVTLRETMTEVGVAHRSVTRTIRVI